MNATTRVLAALFVVFAAANSAAAEPRGAAPKKEAGAPAPSKREGLPLEAGAIVYTRFADKNYGAAAPGLAVALVRPTSLLHGALSLGASAEWRHMSGKRTAADANGRALPQYVLDVDAFPLEGIARLSHRTGAWATWLQGGVGAELAKSSFHEEGLGRRNQNDWALAASTRAGMARAMGHGELGISIGVRSARHAFRDHDYELLHGVESELVWAKRF